jgi:hypothetical protein
MGAHNDYHVGPAFFASAIVVTTVARDPWVNKTAVGASPSPFISLQKDSAVHPPVKN